MDKSRVASGLLCLLLMLFHLGTLGISSPNSPGFDEAALTDYAYHDRLSLWQHILPPGRKNLMNSFGAPLFNGNMKTQRWIMKHTGVGVWQSKIGSAVCGLLGLFILTWMARCLGFPWLCWTGILLFGFSKPFFAITHSARPEGYVFFAMALNWFWYFCARGRLLSFLAGLLATGALVFHQAAIFFLIPLIVMILLVHEKSIFKTPRNYWWAAGAMMGVVYAAHVIDIDRGIQFLQLSPASRSPHIFHNGWNFLSIAGNALDYLYFKSRQGPAWHFLLSCMLLTIALQLRRYRQLPPITRQLLGVLVLMALSFSLFSSSDNKNYIVYLIPWLLFSFLLGADRIIRGGLKFGFTDQFLLASAHALVFSLMFPKFRILPILSFFISLSLNLGCWSKSRLYLAGLAAVLTCAFAVVFFENYFLGLLFGLAYLLEMKPALFLILVILPGLFMLPRQVRIRGDTVLAVPLERAFLTYCFLNIFVLGVAQAEFVGKRFKEISINAQLSEELLTLSGHRRLVAPGEIWLHQPLLVMQGIEALYWGLPLRNHNRIKALLEYNPDLVLWPGNPQDFEEEFKAIDAGKSKKLQWGKIWRFPSGDLRELRIVQKDRGN